MTDTERQDLRYFLAREVMGWKLYEPDCADGWDHSSWVINGKKWMSRSVYRPDDEDSPASQLLGVINTMTGKGWRFKTESYFDKILAAFWSYDIDDSYREAIDDTLPDAVCQAARAALEGKMK
jgi:hypothetical protein